MVRLTIYLVLIIGLSISAWAKIPADSTINPQFQKLADDLRLKKPKLKQGKYEVRIWNRQGLMFGTAQMLYVISNRKESISLSKHVIYSDKDGFKTAVQLKPSTPVTLDIWDRLLQHNLLTLPDETAIRNQLHPQHKDSTWTSVETDGSLSVHAKKMENSVWITDGESYYFEIFSANGYRGYWYSNPRGYIRYKPDIPELQNVVAILDEMAVLFRFKN